MKNKTLQSLFSAGMIVIWSGFYLNGFSQAAKGPVTLSYNYPNGKTIKYITAGKQIQSMDIQGQTMQTDVNSSFGCSIKSMGTQDGNLKLEVTIDTLGQTTNSPMGNTGGSIGIVKGKVCNIVMATNGKVVDYTEAAKLVFEVEGSGESNMAQSIGDFFPVLPSKPVKIGDEWNLTDSSTFKTSTTTMKNIDNTVNKLVGFENVNGIECAKITVVHTGTMTISIQNPQVELTIMGPYSGTSDCLFAVKEGYFLKNTSSTKMTGNLELISPQAMSMPITIEMNAVSEIKN